MPDGADQTITATLATPEVSYLLDTPVGSPMLKGYRVYYLTGKPIMVLESLYRPDRYAYRVRLSAKSPQLAGVWLASLIFTHKFLVASAPIFPGLSFVGWCSHRQKNFEPSVPKQRDLR